MDYSISTWLKNKRIKAGLDLQDLAVIAGSSTAQISRLETGTMSITLNFLVVLLWALKIDLAEFVAELGLPPITLPGLSSSSQSQTIKLEQLREELDNIPTVSTVLEFVQAYENAIPDAINFLNRKFNPAIKKAYPTSTLPENLQGGVQAAIIDGQVLPNPPGLTLETFSEWFDKGGALTLADAGDYLKSLREQQKYSLEALARLSKMTKSTINRMETTPGDRVQFLDVVNLDIALQANGRLLSLYWAVVMHQMGIWFGMKDTQRRPLKKGQVNNLADTFIKVTRWSYLYDDPNLPWIEPWIAPIIEVENALEIFNAYTRGDRHDYMALAREIQALIPGQIHLLKNEDYPIDIRPEWVLGFQIWEAINKAAGNDVFSLRMIKLYEENFNDPNYAAAFRVLLRELMIADTDFFEKMNMFLIKKK